MFSCGGRADGSGGVTSSQLFAFSGGAGPLALQTGAQTNDPNAVVCMAVTSGNVIQEANCTSGDPSQSFTFGGSNSGAAALASGAPASTTNSPPASSIQAQAASSASATGCVSTTTVTVTRSSASASV
jgi:hypothetical protein